MTPALPDGVTIRPLARFEDARGVVMRMLRADDPHFVAFGEIYFSGVREGAVKAWRRHARATANLAVPIGAIRLVLFDARAGGPSRGVLTELRLGADEYALVTVPPGIWTGWQGLGPGLSLVANCATAPHDPSEVDALAADSPDVPYRWPAA
jgi:dTDP-4-dehydrorhamnose 3,5-epimerase